MELTRLSKIAVIVQILYVILVYPIVKGGVNQKKAGGAGAGWVDAPGWRVWSFLLTAVGNRPCRFPPFRSEAERMGHPSLSAI